MADLRAALGAGPTTGSLQVTVFVPSVDRDGRPLESAYWREECLRVLASQFRGATAFPPGRGAWRDDERGGELIYEDTALVTAYADPEALTPEALGVLRRFLHRLGRQTNQGEVGVVIGGDYYGITQYDPAPGDAGGGAAG
jgi:hypothetical protein